VGFSERSVVLGRSEIRSLYSQGSVIYQHGQCKDISGGGTRPTDRQGMQSRDYLFLTNFSLSITTTFMMKLSKLGNRKLNKAVNELAGNSLILC
jgi:hypothetical protein